MLVNITLALIALFVIAIYWYLRKTYSYWNKKNVKCLPSVPFLGSQYEALMQQKSLIQIQKEIYKKYSDGKYVAGYRGLTPELIIFDPEIIRMILVKDFNTFGNRTMPASDKEPLTQNMFSVKGHTWKFLRRKLTPTFTSAKMRLMFPLMVECTKGLERNLSELLKTDKTQEVRELMAQFTTDVIGSCAFGLNMNSMTDKEAIFRKEGRRIFSPYMLRMAVFYLYGLMPKIIKFFKLCTFSVAPSGSEDFFVNITKQIIRERESSPVKRHDFVDLILDVRKQLELEESTNKSEVKLTDELIAGQFFVFFGAGFETSSMTLSFAMYELSQHPNIQKNLQDEIEEILRKHDDKITYEAVFEMKYLHSVIDETLRKYPVVPFLDRSCNTTYKIPGTDLTIDEGVSIVIPVNPLHYDEKYFPEPEKFVPERFLDESKKTYHPFSYLPFGEGPRNCIGMRFGKLQVSVGLIVILRKYSIGMCEETPKEIQYETTTFVPTPVGGIKLRFEPRDSNKTSKLSNIWN